MDAAGWYGFEISGTGKGRYVVRREECVVRSSDPERCGFFGVRDGAPRRFLASSMSDGTLHVLGVLVALFQHADGTGRRHGLIGIEEPEAALHPAAAGALTDILREASEHVQVIVTSGRISKLLEPAPGPAHG